MEAGNAQANLNTLHTFIRNLELPCVVASDNGFRQINNLKIKYGYKNKQIVVYWRDVWTKQQDSGESTLQDFAEWAAPKLVAIGPSTEWISKGPPTETPEF